MRFMACVFRKNSEMMVCHACGLRRFHQFDYLWKTDKAMALEVFTLQQKESVSRHHLSRHGTLSNLEKQASLKVKVRLCADSDFPDPYILRQSIVSNEYTVSTSLPV